MAKTTYVLDTSVYLHDANSIYHFGRNDIVVPLKVLEEIDKHKQRQNIVGANARKVIRFFDSLREKGDLTKGVRIAKGKGKLRAKSIKEIENLPPDLDPNIPDHIIVGTALKVMGEIGNKHTVLVSRDINLRVIADSVGLKTQDYNPDKVVKDTTQLFTGFREILVDQQDVDSFYAGEEVVLQPSQSKGIYANEFLMLISNSNEKTTALARFEREGAPLKAIKDFKSNGSSQGVWGVRPKNKEQNYALDLLLDPNIPIVTLVGKAGCGKTLLAVAAGLEQVLGKEPKYDRIVISRPVQPMGKDIGFLPGSLEEKMAPWLAPIQDNLEFLMGNDKENLNMYLDKGRIQVEALTYIRGRSISKSYIIIDESQNLTSHELKTIITRVGEETKIILTGDIEQIDNAYINETSNGLAYAVEKFKSYDLSGHVTLLRGERSQVATLASKIL
jgi:PhoH-like ATPase